LLVVTPAAAVTAPTYRANDYGNMLNILPAGQNGLLTAADVVNNKLTGAVPPHNHDQYDPSQNLLYGYPGLQDSGLTNFYKDASFGVKPEDIDAAQTVNLSYLGRNVTIYRDKQYGVPHVYGDSVPAMSYGVGYATAHDRLFMIDVLRHTGAGHLAELVGPSCSNEAMDRSQLALTGYTQQDKLNQLDYIAHLGPLGAEARQMIEGEVQGINAYIDQATLPTNSAAMMPAEYPAVTGGLAAHFQASDIIDIASLVGGIFGKGGGNEVGAGHLYQYLQGYAAKHSLPAGSAEAMFRDFKEADDPAAPSTIQDVRFPYNVHDPGATPTAKNDFTDPLALVDDPMNRPGQRDDQCNPSAASILGGIGAALRGGSMSNALLVDAPHSTSGRPIAVFGPQVGYFAPQILMEVDLHAPDFDVRGASFPGTAFLVELGRGQDYAWSATSASNDIVDERLEVLCPNPNPQADTDPMSKYYMSGGICTRMDYHQDNESVVSKPGGMSACLPQPCTVKHDIYRTHHNGADAVVIGFTKDVHGKDVAISSQRSTYGHELDSAIGFLRWQHPSMTYDAQSWMLGAGDIGYTFNWLYADNRDIAYYNSGHDPLRQADYNPDFPTLGTGVAEWTGFLDFNSHPHEVNPPAGYLVSWNNKQAHGTSSSDNQYSYGPIYRSLSLERRIQSAFATRGKMSRASLAAAMEDAASVDLTGAQVVPELVQLRSSITAGLSPSDSTRVNDLLDRLAAWSQTGAHRRRSAHGDAQYGDPAAVAVMDELNGRLIDGIFHALMTDPDPAVKATLRTDAAGVAVGYSKMPEAFADQPLGGLGSSYNGGWESYVVKVLQQMRGAIPGAPLSPAMTAQLCTGGLATCPAAIAKALLATHSQLTAVNGTSTVSSWTADTDSQHAKLTVPQNDAVLYRAVGIVGQPSMDWQNRPTFQQVVDFPTHRPRPGEAPVAADANLGLPPTSSDPGSVIASIVAVSVAVLVAIGVIGRRRRRARRP
jgi:acyl-homoserine lactone acylase PvdQ